MHYPDKKKHANRNNFIATLCGARMWIGEDREMFREIVDKIDAKMQRVRGAEMKTLNPPDITHHVQCPQHEEYECPEDCGDACRMGGQLDCPYSCNCHYPDDCFCDELVAAGQAEARLERMGL